MEASITRSTTRGSTGPARPSPPRRWGGDPEEIGDAAVWLCSDDASFVTGETMVIDGGYVTQ